MKAIYSLVVLSLSALLSACVAGSSIPLARTNLGKQAMNVGNYPTALAYFQQAAQNNPQRRLRRNLAPGDLYDLWEVKPNISPETMNKCVRLYAKSFRSTRATMLQCSTLDLRKRVWETARLLWAISKTA